MFRNSRHERYLERYGKKNDVLQENPEYVRLVFSLFFKGKFNRFTKVTLKFKPEQVYEMLRLQFKGDADLMIPFFFSILDSQQRKLLSAQNRIAELEGRIG